MPYLLIVSELFEPKKEEHCSLRNNAQSIIPPRKTVYQGPESVSYLEHFT